MLLFTTKSFNKHNTELINHAFSAVLASAQFPTPQFVCSVV